jgi:hypothetical protein
MIGASNPRGPRLTRADHMSARLLGILVSASLPRIFVELFRLNFAILDLA